MLESIGEPVKNRRKKNTNLKDMFIFVQYCHYVYGKEIDC